ncbi:MAG: Mrp/NBP35 family ATP-binding protein [Micrococcales bacterium]|nr:Mrp/NBP35 family ATP-binding protein [Micrococcales bacterium]
MALLDDVRSALATVIDPEIRQPITDLGMVRSVEVDAGVARVGIDLTIAACPMRDTLSAQVRAAVEAVAGVDEVVVELGAMSDSQRAQLRNQLRGSGPANPFAESTTQVIAVASGKGGVGKSSVTANLAVALAAEHRVGVIDADVHGFSIPRMLGAEQMPTKVDNMLLPPVVHGVKVVSIGMFVPPGQPVVWRGPRGHRALQQFLSDVFWGDLDVLLLDLPPGTGDIAISVAELLPTSRLLVVTTPQAAAAEVAERAGALAAHTHQSVVGVLENMSWLDLPDGTRLEVFGSGGGQQVADRLSQTLGTDVPLLGQVPIDMALREAGDAGTPVTISAPQAPAAVALTEVASTLMG